METASQDSSIGQGRESGSLAANRPSLPVRSVLSCSVLFVSGDADVDASLACRNRAEKQGANAIHPVGTNCFQGSPITLDLSSRRLGNHEIVNCRTTRR